MKDIQLFSRVTFLDKMLFTKHLAVMIKSGISLVDALDTLEHQTKSEAFKAVLHSVLSRVENGESLGKALAQHPKVFDKFYTSLIDVGEESGNLEVNLEFLAKQLAKDYALRKKVQGAMLYPGIVFTAAVVIGAAISIFVLPQFIGLFSSFDVELPLSTRVLLFIATTMKLYGVYIFAGIVAGLFLFRLFVQLPGIKGIWHGFLLSLPVFGIFLQNVQLATLFRNLGVMLKSGLTITSALQMQYDQTTNIVFKSYAQRLLTAVTKGRTLADELTEEKFRFVPTIAVKMIQVGEKTGSLDGILLYLGDFFEDEVDNSSKNFSTLVEPVMLLLIGLVVAFVAMAIFSPIYQLTGSIRR